MVYLCFFPPFTVIKDSDYAEEKVRSGKDFVCAAKKERITEPCLNLHHVVSSNKALTPSPFVPTKRGYFKMSANDNFDDLLTLIIFFINWFSIQVQKTVKIAT